MKETISGIIIKKKIGGTSKSAHTAFVLKTASEELKLRRVGGNPFYDKYFEDYKRYERRMKLERLGVVFNSNG
jgi:hypothetical protein